MKIEAISSLLSAGPDSKEDGPRLVRVRITGPADPANPIVRRARELLRERTTGDALRSFEDALARQLVGNKE